MMTAHTCLCKLGFESVKRHPPNDGSAIHWTDDAITPVVTFDVLSKSQVDPTPALGDNNVFFLVPLIPFKAPLAETSQLECANDLEGMIGYYKGEDQDVIDDVIRLAAKHKVVAVLVVKQPLNPIDLPVFVLPTKYMDSVRSQKWKVSITVQRPLAEDGDDSINETKLGNPLSVTENLLSNTKLAHGSVIADGRQLGAQVLESKFVEQDVFGKADEGLLVDADNAKEHHGTTVMQKSSADNAHWPPPISQAGLKLPSYMDHIKQLLKEAASHPLMEDGVDITLVASDVSSIEHSGTGSFETLSPSGSNLEHAAVYRSRGYLPGDVDSGSNLEHANECNATVDGSLNDPTGGDVGLKTALPVGTSEEEKPQSLVGWLTTYVGDKVTSLVKAATLDDLLRAKDGWSQARNYGSYKNLSRKVSELTVRSGSESELEDMACQVCTFLSTTKGTLLHLVFAAQLALTHQSSATEELSRVVLRRLSEMKRTYDNQPSRFDFRNGPKNLKSTTFRFLSRRFMSQLDLNNGDDRLVTLFWLWIDCGLFLQMKDVDWNLVRSQVDEGFCQRAREKLVESLGRNRADMLRFSLCRSLDECLEVLKELRARSKRIPKVDEVFTEILFAWADELVKKNANDPESLLRLWATMYDILKHVELVPTTYGYESQIRSRFVSSIVSLSGFLRFGSLRLYVPLVEAAYPDHRDYATWMKAVRWGVCQDICLSGRGCRHPSMVDVASLITCSAFQRLQNPFVIDSILSFSQRMMDQSEACFYDKLTYLGNLHRMFSSIQRQKRLDPKWQLLELLGLAVQKETLKSTVLECCIRVAAKQPDIFEGSLSLGQAMSDRALSADDGKQFATNIFDLSTSLSLVPSGSHGQFLLALLDRLSEVIFDGFESVDTSSRFYEQVIHLESPAAKLRELATTVFCRMFRKWCPTTFPRLAMENIETLKCVFQCLSNSVQNVLNEDERTSLKDCKATVKAVVENWCLDFRSDKISGVDLMEVLPFSLTPTWSIIVDFTSTELPTNEDICVKCDAFNQSLAVIVGSIFTEGSSNSSVQDVLKGYNCHFDPKTQIGRIFDEYDFLHAQNDNTNSKKSIGEVSMLLCTVKDDAVFAEAFRKKHDWMISLCDYFLRNSSVLFRNVVSDLTKNKVEINTLADTLVRARESIRSLFSPEADYDLVDKAARVVVDAESTLERELSILLGSAQLDLTNAGVKRFKFIALLACFEIPLQGFISFCEQGKFALVSCDPVFDELKLVSVQLRERKQAPSDTLESLHRLLCPRISSKLSPENIRQEMSHRLPVLQFVSDLSMNVEVWLLAREMGWIGKGGLKRFHDEYANVTNVLLGNTESYEMAVLDSLGTTIPSVALLGGLREAKTLEHLLDRLEENSDLSRCHVGGDLSDLKQVQRNISLIRDWFTHGVDEVSAVYGVFEAVKATGEYLVIGVDDDKIRRISPELVLKYQIEKSGSMLSTSMSGDLLSNFVQHVGLIQHEVGEFIEQYHVIAKAFRLLSEVSVAGYNDVQLESFCCRAGDQSLAEARDLLACAETKAREFDSWLRRVRQTYPVSLLFWTEELRVLHQHTLVIDEDEGRYIDAICQMTSRLCFSHCTATEQKLALVSVLKLFNQDVTHKTEGWLVSISRFVEQLHVALGGPIATTLGQVIRQEQEGEIVLHTIECDTHLRNLATQVLMQQIYKSKLPKEYEVLDCVGNCVSSEKLSLFLQRSLLFRGSTFVVLHADNLDGRLTEKLLSYLSCRETACAGIRFHCLQRQSSILHTAPWVDGKTWDSQSLDLPSMGVSKELHPWRQLVANRSIQLSIVCSEKSGRGKSQHITNQINYMKAQDADATVGLITLHEGTTIHSLTSDLCARFPPGATKQVVHFSFMYTPELLPESVRWLEDVNHFFFSFLILGCVQDPTSHLSFHRGERAWHIFVELPSEGNMSAVEWLWQHIPVLAFCGTVQEPSSLLTVDEETRRVCTYLRAFDDGTINRKFKNAIKRIMFVLDVSSSMSEEVGNGQSAFEVARGNAIGVFDSHIHPGDTFGVVTFHKDISVAVPCQEVTSEDHKAKLRNDLVHIQRIGRGTNMYDALQHAVTSMQHTQDSLESWIICLTDGVTSGTHHALKASLLQSPSSLHVVVIGVSLRASYQSRMRLLCAKYRPEQATKGFFVATNANFVALNQAFQTVESRIPVSQTFELDGMVSDDDCRVLLDKYAPSCLPKGDMLLHKFWIRFLYRRVKVFDENKSFNYNEKYEELGSSLMETMLSEVERLLETHQSRDWVDTNHTQLIYDFSSGSPEFRLICTSPETLDLEARQRLERLDLPGFFFIPTSEQLRQRNTLNCFLSQALGISLDKLRCIDDNGFILTLDFTMKLLNIHERVACRIPCIIEGETGVSKTALTKMYAILRNSSLQVRAKASTQKDLNDICQALTDDGFFIASAASALDSLHHALQEASELTIGNETELAGRIHHLIVEKCTRRSAFFRRVPSEFDVAENLKTTSVVALLDWFEMSHLEPTFFEVNVDASLTETDIVSSFEEIRSIARRLLDLGALVVVFLDEINTSSAMGLFKEIVVDKSLRGEALEENIVVIAACNPTRTRLAANFVNPRENDLGKDWASGHYQVTALPPSMAKLKWAFGALNKSQENEFVFRRLEKMVGGGLNQVTKMVFTEVIAEAQEAMRTFAQQNILEGLKRTSETFPGMKQRTVLDMQADACSRAKSAVSLRDIQRVFSLYEFFTTDFKYISEIAGPDRGYQQNAMMLAIAIVYFLRLDSKSRNVFLDMMMNLLAKVGETTNLQLILEAAMDIVVKDTDIPKGIAITRGLKENVFMTLVCSLSQIPLLIIGPPGSSKTLSVNVVSDNANGEDSARAFYRQFARLSVFHYQCSKQSTSREIATVFEKATQRQEKVDGGRHRCVVFMDEAGLPEEERESLKVLHYLLEGHMSAKAKVGFVGISNHALDAAKSNRCITLLRQAPDEEEMLCITTGVLFGSGRGKRVSQVKFGESLIDAVYFSSTVSSTYTRLLHDKVKFDWFETFFGLRDYIYFLKALRMRASVDALLFVLTHQSFIIAIERNFNGIEAGQLHQICFAFLVDLINTQPLQLTAALVKCMRHPIDVLTEATTKDKVACEVSKRARFKLIIDCTDDDSIMRLLGAMDIVDLSSKSLYMLSQMPEEKELEQLRVVCGVKFSALQGKLAVMSQTEEVNECFYDLFNQHFRAVQGRSGEISLFANIAVGGVSRRSLVRQEFSCVVHVRESQLDKMPAPFLNRFEKYRLSTSDVLSSGCRLLGNLSGYLLNAQEQVARVVSVLDQHGLFGFVDGQTIDSIFIDMLPKRALTPSSMLMYHENGNETSTFSECLLAFIFQVTSQDLKDHIEAAIADALFSLPANLSNLLQQLSSKSTVEADFLWKCFGSLVSESHDESEMVKLLGALFQMVTTRMAAFRLMQIATPESVFCRRNELPADLVREYFNQEHFSLKKLIASAEKSAVVSKDTKMLIACTRSDAVINRIPSYSIKSDNSMEIIKALVHDNPDLVVVEHLEALRSESRLRSSLIGWIDDSRRTTYVLIIDIGNSGAMDRTNFVRMFLEQTLDPRSGKVIVLLLHFPQSSGTFYPALFLGRWQHFFLDGVGQIEHNAGVDKFIEVACLKRNDSDFFGLYDDRQLRDIAERLESVLPRVLSHVATKKILHPDQLKTKDFKTGHSARCDFLLSLMKRRVGSQTVGKLLCEKFGRLWLQGGLNRTIRRASERLRAGTTNLSLSMSLLSSLLETFDTFVSLQLCEMNHGRNLDIMLQDVVSQEAEELFGFVLQSLPVVPFDELILRRREGCVVRGLLVTESRKCKLMVFPFFDFIASCLFEVVEAALKDVSQGSFMVESDSGVDEYFRALHAHSYELLHVDESDQSIQIQRRKCAFQAVEYVRSAGSKSPSLFSGYVDQLIEKIVGTTERDAPNDWLRSEVTRLGFEQDMLAIHVVCKVREAQLLSLASWSTRFGPFFTWSFELNSGTEGGQLGLFFFNKFLDYFEASLLDLSRQEWKSSFSLFFHESVAMLAHNCILDVRQTRRMRALCFFYVVADGSTSDLERNLLRRWYDTKSRALVPTALEHVSLFDFAEVVTKGGCNDVVQISLWLFFSTTWMKLTTSFRDDDFKFLIKMITGGELTGNSCHMAVSLLRNAFSSFGASTSLLGLQTWPLQLVANTIATGMSAEFSENGERNSVSHFVPDWLQRPDYVPDKAKRPVCKDLFGVFFADCTPCFRCELSQVVFEGMLRGCLEQTESWTSDTMLLSVLTDIINETGCNRQEFTRLARMRAAEGDWESFKGTPVASIGVAARLVCFVAKVAHELASTGQSYALSGTHFETSRALLEGLMSIDFLRWDDFFIGTILRLRGEGTLAELLKPGGTLGNFNWCRKWATGEPALMQGIENQLAKAERDLAEATYEEERKVQEFRLCPYCSREFIVAARQCGRFVCGRDYHSENQPVGCGREFQIDRAPHYTANERVLAPIREWVQQERTRLQASHEGTLLWTRARTFVVPVLDFHAVKTTTVESMVPTAYVIPPREKIGDDEQARNYSLFRLLECSTSLVEKLKVLPDLIELYLWLHSTFKHLVTNDRAFSLAMNDVVTKERLRCRFDLVHADHIASLWRRLNERFDQLLESMEYKVQWQCQELCVPFKKLEEARLIHLLSEGDDPSEGNDYLFLVINDIIDQYNSFIRRLSELELGKHETLPEDTIHPKFVVSGYGGASLIFAVPVLSRFELKTLVESGWNEVAGAFDMDLLRKLLHLHVFLDKLPPVIKNPTTYLREKFVFRDDTEENPTWHQAAGGVSRNVQGDYYANMQDFTLYNDVCTLLGEFDLTEGNGDLTRTLQDHFYNFSYDQLRSCLEGLRNILQMLQTAGASSISDIGEALCRAMNFSKADLTIHSKVVLRQVGFPALSNPQNQLMLSLSGVQLVDLVHFVGHQLATEAYVFASLPLCLTEPLSEADRICIVEGLQALNMKVGAAKIQERLTEFVRDVLSFYESEISKKALCSGQQLRAFLLENNCCDESDAIFELLPRDLTVRNYIALRQLFHQAKLKMRFDDEANLKTESEGVAGENSVATKEVSWLWTEERDCRSNYVETESSTAFYAESLWFETATAAYETHNDGGQIQACKIQRWWRQVASNSRNRDRFTDELKTFGVSVRGRVEWEVLSEKDDYEHLPAIDIECTGDDRDHESVVSSWTYESLYHGKGDDGSNGENASRQLYGSTEDEMKMRRWLNDHKLHQSVGDYLVRLGVHEIDDVVLLLEEGDAELKDVTPLDMIKLKRAVRSYQAMLSSPKSLNN